uniref:Uncharacterized protein n=1 Tax=Anopheles dirus TaxID=7168 RepID=A0A182N7W9_9DIPT
MDSKLSRTTANAISHVAYVGMCLMPTVTVDLTMKLDNHTVDCFLVRSVRRYASANGAGTSVAANHPMLCAGQARPLVRGPKKMSARKKSPDRGVTTGTSLSRGRSESMMWTHGRSISRSRAAWQSLIRPQHLCNSYAAAKKAPAP